MGDALLDMLPYSIGLIVSPLPVAAMILLLVSRNGMRKATTFAITWLLVSMGVLMGLATLVSNAAPRDEGAEPAWERILVIVLGLMMLGLAFVVWRAWRKQRLQGGEPEPPRWMLALDQMSTGKVVLLAAALIVANPVNFSMLVAAAVELGRHQLAASQNLLPAALFVLIGSVTLLTPYVVTLVAGRKAGFLPRARQWLLRHNNMLSFWLTLAFGLIFLIKGLQG